MSVALYGNGAFADGPVEMRSLGWALIQYDGYLYNKGNLETEKEAHTGKMPGEGGDWKDASISQGMPKICKAPGTRREA